jgi:hypothetical protein
VKSLIKRNGPKAPTSIHGPLSLNFLQVEKVHAIADCSKNNFTHHDLCDENHEGGWMIEFDR